MNPIGRGVYAKDVNMYRAMNLHLSYSPIFSDFVRTLCVHIPAFGAWGGRGGSVHDIEI